MIFHCFFIVEFILLINKSLSCTTPEFSNLTVASKFSLQSFLGRWYEIKWLPGKPHNQSDIWLEQSQDFQLENTTSQRLFVSGKARLFNQEQCFSFGPWIIRANNSAKMILERKNINDTLLNWPYYVLEVDYNNYALVFGCASLNYSLNTICKEPILWVLSRERSLSSQYTKNLDDIIQNKLCINLTQLEITPHTDKSCFPSSSSSNFEHSLLTNIIFLNILILHLFLINK